ncbi:small multi-drug export protein [Alkalicoccus chagannorensis]|uniref:small multi-drug export protein n=1 Tax=Alkalicoccus chagannorensis TaxID=427072 RepID=UPI000428BD73|nr:small multi-drug export protein [Alkalicoccus chagannorensis]
MWDYIVMSATAWLLGFLPIFEIYLAVPAAIGMGLDPVSAVLWGTFGNFVTIPFLVYCYSLMTKINWMHRWLLRMADSKFSRRMRDRGFLYVLLATPLIGAWAVGVVGKVADMDKARLFLSSLLSIFLCGVVIAFFTVTGIELFS